MVLPIYTLDLLYYKRMFWHHNNLANAEKPDHEKMTQVFSDAMTTKIFAFVEEVFNTGNTFFLDELNEALDKENFAGEPINYVEIEIKNLREKVRSLGWDPRIRVMVKEQKIGNAFQTLHFFMDLDATIKALSEEQEEVYRSEIKGSDIIDAPSAEQLSDYFNKTDIKNKDQTST